MPGKPLEVPFGTVWLSRWPARPGDRLQAWDAADDYLIRELFAAGQRADSAADAVVSNRQSPDTRPPGSLRWLIINDVYGALSCAMHAWAPVHWSDSLVSQQAAKANLAANALVPRPSFVPGTRIPPGPIDRVVARVPKNIALLDDQLQRVRPILAPDAHIVAAGMVKYLPRSAFQCLERHIGPVTTSLARKKARLLFARLEPRQVADMPSRYPSEYHDAETGLTLSNDAAVFSRERLDAGARLMIQCLAQAPLAADAIDLACGNGVLGIVLRQHQPSARITFVDESYMAVASAQRNSRRLFPSDTNSAFRVADGLTDTASNSVDLVVCNPPFHEQHALSERVAADFFVHARRCLRSDGELWVVANRHLPYKARLMRLFSSCTVLKATSRFVVYRARQPRPT